MTEQTPDREALAVHDLKVWPPYFDALASGTKTFEVRKDDRDIAVGDLLRLREWQPYEGGAVFCPTVGSYTGREVERRVTYVLRGDEAHYFGIEVGYCILALDVPALRAENERLRGRVADYERAINWGVTCVACASRLDGEYRDTVRAEKAEAALDRVRATIRLLLPDEMTPTAARMLRAALGEDQ